MKDSQNQKKKKRVFKKKKTNTARSAKDIRSSASSSKILIGSFLPFRKKKTGPQAAKHMSAEQEKKTESLVAKHEHKMVLLLIPIILLVVLATIYTLNENISERLQTKKLATSSKTNVSAYPVIAQSYQPILSAKAALVMDAGTQTIIYSKNPQLRFSMASTVKIMTALVGMDHYRPGSVLTVKSGGIQGSIIGVRRGESFYFEDLLYAMLLPSANDAAVVILDNYPGGKDAFVKKMNEKAKEFHLTNTQFSEPTGLDDDENFTTVVDLARLGSIAMQNRDFAKIVSTQQKIITNQRKTKQYELENLNRMLGINGVNGVKTGTTEGAGEVLVTSAIQHGRIFIIVVMNSEDRFEDTTTLLNFVADNVEFVTPTFVSDRQ